MQRPMVTCCMVCRFLAWSPRLAHLPGVRLSCCGMHAAMRSATCGHMASSCGTYMEHCTQPQFPACTAHCLPFLRRRCNRLAMACREMITGGKPHRDELREIRCDFDPEHLQQCGTLTTTYRYLLCPTSKRQLNLSSCTVQGARGVPERDRGAAVGVPAARPGSPPQRQAGRGPPAGAPPGPAPGRGGGEPVHGAHPQPEQPQPGAAQHHPQHPGPVRRRPQQPWHRWQCGRTNRLRWRRDFLHEGCLPKGAGCCRSTTGAVFHFRSGRGTGWQPWGGGPGGGRCGAENAAAVGRGACRGRRHCPRPGTPPAQVEPQPLHDPSTFPSAAPNVHAWYPLLQCNQLHPVHKSF